jgi:charged multivesicular body protein 6
LKVGNEALKKIHEVLNVGEVERILEETREGIEKQRVCIVSHILSVIITYLLTPWSRVLLEKLTSKLCS